MLGRRADGLRRAPRRGTCGRAVRARRRRARRSRGRRWSTTARPRARSSAPNCSMCSTTRIPARVLRIANGSDHVVSGSPGTSGRWSSTSCSPCTPLRPDSNTSVGTTALAAYCASNTRITGYVGGTTSPASAPGSVSLVAAAYAADRRRARARPGTARGAGRDRRRRHPRRGEPTVCVASVGASSSDVQVGIHLPQFGRAASPDAITAAARLRRSSGSPTCG